MLAVDAFLSDVPGVGVHVALGAGEVAATTALSSVAWLTAWPREAAVLSASAELAPGLGVLPLAWPVPPEAVGVGDGDPELEGGGVGDGDELLGDGVVGEELADDEDDDGPGLITGSLVGQPVLVGELADGFDVPLSGALLLLCEPG